MLFRSVFPAFVWVLFPPVVLFSGISSQVMPIIAAGLGALLGLLWLIDQPSWRRGFLAAIPLVYILTVNFMVAALFVLTGVALCVFSRLQNKLSKTDHKAVLVRFVFLTLILVAALILYSTTQADFILLIERVIRIPGLLVPFAFFIVSQNYLANTNRRGFFCYSFGFLFH